MGGGKSPLLVFEDADLDLSVQTAHNGVFFNHGQCCNACTRVFVHASLYDKFMEKTVAMAKARKLGDPFGDADQGPQVDKLQFDKILGYLQHARDSGAKIAVGGNKAFDKGYFVQPTVLEGLGSDHTCYREEIFGPVMSVTKFETEEEAIRMANDTNYGLAAGVMSRNTDTLNRVIRHLRAGTVWVNTYHVFDNATPFGGYKDSGVGREKGAAVLENYLQNKTVIQPLHGDACWYR